MSVANDIILDNDSSSTDSTEDSITNIFNMVILPGVDVKTLCPRTTFKEKEPIPKSNWWHECWPKLLPRAFKRIYRMSRATLNALVDFLLEYSLEDRPRFIRSVCITVNYLAVHERMYDLQIKYNCALGVVYESIKMVIDLIIHYLLPSMVQWPNCHEREQIQKEIFNKYKIPMCIGMTDATYIYCKGYGPTPMDYTCRKFDYAFNVVLFMDHNLMIRHFISNNVGAKGDNDILLESGFYKDIFNKFNISTMSQDFNNSVGLSTYFIVADKGLAVSNFIITPFDERGRVLSTQQHSFNYYLSKFRSLAEITIGMLKLRFLILKERVNSTKPDNADRYIRACIALHNFSIANGDLIYQKDLDENDMVPCRCEFCTNNQERKNTQQVEDLDVFGYKNARNKLFDYYKKHHL